MVIGNVQLILVKNKSKSVFNFNWRCYPMMRDIERDWKLEKSL